VRVRLSGAKFSVTDRPFTESKEIVGGFALIEAKSKEEAIEDAKDFLKIAGEGETEIRQIFEGLPSVRRAIRRRPASATTKRY
jgi:hypothetical protein